MAFNVANSISDTSVSPNYRGIFKLLYLLIAIAVIFGLGLMVIYNGLIHDRNLADSAFSTIDIMLKRRADLIPNLVQAVKGYMQHEASLLRQITELRSQALQATRYLYRTSSSRRATDRCAGAVSSRGRVLSGLESERAVSATAGGAQ